MIITRLSPFDECGNSKKQELTTLVPIPRAKRQRLCDSENQNIDNSIDNGIIKALEIAVDHIKEDLECIAHNGETETFVVESRHTRIRANTRTALQLGVLEALYIAIELAIVKLVEALEKDERMTLWTRNSMITRQSYESETDWPGIIMDGCQLQELIFE